MGYHQAASQMNRVLLVLKACGAESGVGGGQIREERCILDADTGLVIRSHRVGWIEVAVRPVGVIIPLEVQSHWGPWEEILQEERRPPSCMTEDEVGDEALLLLGEHHFVGSLAVQDGILEGPYIMVRLRRWFTFALIDDLTDPGHFASHRSRQEADLVGGIGTEDGRDGPELRRKVGMNKQNAHWRE